MKWSKFAEDQRNTPILELFSSIIKDKSIGWNRFLDLCQALEVYSDQYWNDESSKIVKEGIQTGKTNDKRITLRIRLIDLFKK